MPPMTGAGIDCRMALNLPTKAMATAKIDAFSEGVVSAHTTTTPALFGTTSNHPIGLGVFTTSEAAATGYTQYGPLKADTAAAVVEYLRPLQERYRELAGDPAHRFDDVPVLLGEGGALTLPDGLAQFGTSIHREVEAGDHTIVLLRLHEVRQDDTAMPLVFHRSTFDSLLAPR